VSARARAARPGYQRGTPALSTPDGEAPDLADVLAALVGEGPDALGDRHIGRVSLVLEVLNRHQG
jgi:hypothetical protein